MDSTEKKLEHINISFINSNKVVRQVKFHRDFDKRDWDDQKEYLIALASSLNNAAETAYNERNEMFEQMQHVMELNKNAAQKAETSQNLMVQSITESNAEKQSLMKVIAELKKEIKSKDYLEASQEGMPFLDTQSHNPPVTVGGVTLARVVEIINGYTVTFEDGAYAVNLVGANSNIGDVVNLNQVSIRSNNSAGLTFSEQINDQSFLDARVYINQTEGLPGIVFPRGTPTDPVDNYADAVSIADARKFSKFDVFGLNLTTLISAELRLG